MAKLSDLKPNTNQKVLVIGDSGNGKTVLASSFPGRKHFADFDGKVISAASYWSRVKPAQIDEIDYDDHFADQANADQYSKFYTKLVEFEKQAKEGKLSIGTYVLDSLTTYADALMKEIMRQNPGVKGAAPGVPGLQHYGIMNLKFKEQLGRMLALPCHVVVTAHIDVTKDDNTGEVIRQAKLPGKLASYLPIVFGEVYRAYTETKDGKTVYMLQTKSDGKFSCRSQIAGLPDRIVSSYENIVKAY